MLRDFPEIETSIPIVLSAIMTAQMVLYPLPFSFVLGKFVLYTELPDKKIRFEVSSWNNFYLIDSMFSSLKFLALGELLMNVQSPEVTPQPSPGRLAKESGSLGSPSLLIPGFAVGIRTEAT